MTSRPALYISKSSTEIQSQDTGAKGRESLRRRTEEDKGVMVKLLLKKAAFQCGHVGECDDATVNAAQLRKEGEPPRQTDCLEMNDWLALWLLWERREREREAERRAGRQLVIVIRRRH